MKLLALFDFPMTLDCLKRMNPSRRRKKSLGLWFSVPESTETLNLTTEMCRKIVESVKKLAANMIIGCIKQMHRYKQEWAIPSACVLQHGYLKDGS